MPTIRQDLEERYKKLFIDYNLEAPIIDGGNIALIMKRSLQKFLKNAKNPAIYGFGEHTTTLMADFIFELKKVKYIIDDTDHISGRANGFILIHEDEINKYEIDTVIVSSVYSIRKTIKERLNLKFPNLPILDFYDEFEKNGLQIQTEYYHTCYPYQHYMQINKLQYEISQCTDESVIKEKYQKLLTKYLYLKDFRTAILTLNNWRCLHFLNEEEKRKLERLQTDVTSLYTLQQQAAASLSEKHVLMLCFDGLRQQDLSEHTMPKLKKLLNTTSYCFTNAYSCSTSTYESLKPAYSGNNDLRTRYYETVSIDSNLCSFVSMAKSQNRDIYFYCDGVHYTPVYNFYK